MPWRPGQSGNPQGRKVGTRCKATVAAETLLQGEAERLTRRAIELALGGDTTALRLCLERIIPPQKAGRTVKLRLPPVNTPADLVAALGGIAEAVAGGVITPEEGQHVAALLEQQRRAVETMDLEQRIARLEAKHAP